ncbi:hypothetical protein NUH16_008467 [Penicillium rubens]|jgi:hypothetical protein|nr:uncharacterized protein N7525_006614 [Penicillium rubens]KAJ5049944.1 hypothetical protein NUH16_008467 [Penicillium rubens]KAJ5828361.1 hypothetical protein N7525_006614 [Penicillium rubens]KAJ5841913.1 hypothetical protein N7534_011743 [Penicillium rubens]
MSSHHPDMEASRPSDAEVQEPRGTASFDAEELEVSSGTTLVAPPSPIDSDGTLDILGVLHINPWPEQTTSFVSNDSNYQFAGRHVGLRRVWQHFRFAGRHTGLGLRQRLRGFASRQVDRYRRRRQRRERRRREREDSQLDNLVTSRLARFSLSDIEDPLAWERRRVGNVFTNHHARFSHQNIEDPTDPVAWERRRVDNLLANRQASSSHESIEDPVTSERRRVETLLANREARTSDHDLEEFISQQPDLTVLEIFPSQIETVLETSLLQLDENQSIESQRPPDPTSQRPIRTASPVHSFLSRESNIAYYGRPDDNNDSRDDNIDDYVPSGSEGSQVRRGRSPRRAESIVSDAASEVRGSDHPSRESSYERPRGRQLMRDSSIVTDPWAAYWGPIGYPPSDLFSRVQRSASSRRSGSIDDDASSGNRPLRDRSPQVRRGRALRRAGSRFSDAFPEVRRTHPDREPSDEEQRGRQLLRTSSIVTDPWAELWGPIGQGPQGESSESSGYLEVDAGYDSAEEWARTNLRVAEWVDGVEPYTRGSVYEY